MATLPVDDRWNGSEPDGSGGIDWRDMSVAPTSDEPARLTVVSPREALRRARPLPSDEDMKIEGLTNEEWEAFERALAGR